MCLGLRLKRVIFHEQIRERIHLKFKQLRDPVESSSFYNNIVNTPEFSRFVIGVPMGVLIGAMGLALAPPSTMPLIFEKLIPYHMKTIIVTCTFFSFADLANLALAQRKFPLWVCVYGLGSVLGSACILTYADSDPRKGYMGVLAFLACHGLSVWHLAMPGWLRTYRLLFMGLAGASIVLSHRRMQFLEKHWDSVVLSTDM